jgi:hypothetical protein
MQEASSMKITFNPSRARIIAAVAAALIGWLFLQRHVNLGMVNLRLPELKPVHVVGCLAVLSITVVGLACLFWKKR